MARENYCTSHYFCFILKCWHICRCLLSLTTAFTLNTVYFTIIFYRIRIYFVKMKSNNDGDVIVDQKSTMARLTFIRQFGRTYDR